jgi:hypothetical protein
MRQATNRLIDMMDEGLISAQAVAEMALAYMSEDDVADMMRCNDILEEEDEDDGQPDEMQEWADFDADC